jgi:hypothetical protein
MSKFIKRIQKASLAKHIFTVILIGDAEENIHNIVDGVDSVFSINSSTPPPRHKKIIPLEDRSFIAGLTNIDAVFINQRFSDVDLQFIPSLTKKCAPIILLSNLYPISTEHYTFFKRIHYEMIVEVENYQVWKIIRK